MGLDLLSPRTLLGQGKWGWIFWTLLGRRGKRGWISCLPDTARTGESGVGSPVSQTLLGQDRGRRGWISCLPDTARTGESGVGSPVSQTLLGQDRGKRGWISCLPDTARTGEGGVGSPVSQTLLGQGKVGLDLLSPGHC